MAPAALRVAAFIGVLVAGTAGYLALDRRPGPDRELGGQTHPDRRRPGPEGSPLAGKSLRDAHIRDSTGALVLALRETGGEFTTNPPPESTLSAGQILIAIGTEAQLKALAAAARP